MQDYVSRGSAYLGALAAIAAGAVVLWLALFASFALTRLQPGGSAFLAPAIVSPVIVFAGLGALACSARAHAPDRARDRDAARS